MRSTPRHSAASRAFALSAHGTPLIGGSASARSNSSSPAPSSGWGTPLAGANAGSINDPRGGSGNSSGSSGHLCSPAFGSPFSSLSTPPSMALDAPRPWSASRNLGLHPFDLDVFDIDHYLARSYSAQVPLVSRIVPLTAVEQRRQYHVLPNPPSVRDVWRLLKRLFDQARLNAECVIIALIYIERLMDTRGLALTPRNWIVVVATALLTASKIQDDHASFNAEFAAILPLFTLRQVNHMERVFLSTISYELYISADTYSAYYFGLKSIQGIRNTREIPRSYQAVGAGDAAIHATAMAQAQAAQAAQAAAAAQAQAAAAAAAKENPSSSSGGGGDGSRSITNTTLRAPPSPSPSPSPAAAVSASSALSAANANLAATAKQVEAKTSAGTGAPEDVAPRAEFMV